MSASSSNPQDDSDKLLLRWSESPHSPSREEFVQILETRVSEAVISVSLRVDEKTQVYLIGKNSTESGIVRSCQRRGKKFVITILLNSVDPHSPSGPEIDPGVLLVDSFMSEEDEQRILDEIDEEIENQQFRSAASAKAYLRNSRWEGTATLNRVFKGTVRSSTALVSNSLGQVLDRFRQVAGTCSFARPLTGTPVASTASPAARKGFPAPSSSVH
jgi:hypothetical protein